MQKYINNVQDTFGNAIGSVTVTIRTNPGGVLATIFSSNSGGAKSNPFTNNSDGEFAFYAVDGRYDIELTGPVTETKFDVRLLDVLTTGTSLRINADINTATPPTTEGVTAKYQIYDLANNDVLAEMGYGASNELRITNRMHGGSLKLRGENSAGSVSIMFEADPDGSLELYNPASNVVRMSMIGGGQATLKSDGNTDTENRGLRLEHQDGTDRGFFGNLADGNLYVRNQIHGGLILIDAEDAGGAARTILTADPDGDTVLRGRDNLDLQVGLGESAFKGIANGAAQMFHNNVIRISTAGSGTLNLKSDGNTDTEVRELIFEHQDGTNRGFVGHAAGTTIYLDNKIHGGGVIIRAEDAGGTTRTILNADPDNTTTLTADTDLHLKVKAGSQTALLATADAGVELYHGGTVRFRTINEDVLASGTGAEIRHADESFYPVGMNTAPELATLDSGNLSLARDNVAKMLTYNTATARQLDFPDDSNIPLGQLWALLVGPSAGVLTGDGETGVQIRYWNGTGWTTTAAAGNITIGKGQYTIWKETNTLYWISGPDLSY